MSFTVTRKSLQEKTFQGQHTWPLEVQVVSTDGSFPAEIFCYRRGQEGQAAFAGDVFTNVASILDMSEMGLQPALLEGGKMQPCFRKDTLLFDCRSPSEADQLFEDVLEDIQDLLRNAEAKTRLQIQTTLQL